MADVTLSLLLTVDSCIGELVRMRFISKVNLNGYTVISGKGLGIGWIFFVMECGFNLWVFNGYWSKARRLKVRERL